MCFVIYGGAGIDPPTSALQISPPTIGPQGFLAKLSHIFLYKPLKLLAWAEKGPNDIFENRGVEQERSHMM